MTMPADTPTAVTAPAAAATPAAEASPPSGSGPRDGGIDSPRAAPSSWIDGLDADHRRVAELKGWKTPGDAVKGYAHLEKALGADKLALPAKGADGNRDFAAWDGWAQLGRPAKADDYRFANGADPLAAAMRPALHAAGLAQWQVDKISGAFTEHAKASRPARRRPPPTTAPRSSASGDPTSISN